MMLTPASTPSQTPAFLNFPPPPTTAAKKSVTDDSHTSSPKTSVAESLRKRHSFASLRAMRNAEEKQQQKSETSKPMNYTTESTGERGRLRNQKSMEKPPWNPSFHVQAPAPPLPPLNRTRTINPKYAPPPPQFIKKERSLTPKRTVISPPLLCSQGSTANSSCNSQKSEESTSPLLTQRRLTVTALPARPWDSTTTPVTFSPSTECDYKKLNALKYNHVQSKVSTLIKQPKPIPTPPSTSSGIIEEKSTRPVVKKTLSLGNVTPDSGSAASGMSSSEGGVGNGGAVTREAKKENMIGAMRKAMSTVFSSKKTKIPELTTTVATPKEEAPKTLKKQPSVGTLKPKKPAPVSKIPEPVARINTRRPGESRPYSSNLCVNPPPPPVPVRSNRRARASLGKIDLESVRPPSENLAAVSESSSKQEL